jgi:hypothetical protein
MATPESDKADMSVTIIDIELQAFSEQIGTGLIEDVVAGQMERGVRYVAKDKCGTQSGILIVAGRKMLCGIRPVSFGVVQIARYFLHKRCRAFLGTRRRAAKNAWTFTAAPLRPGGQTLPYTGRNGIGQTFGMSQYEIEQGRRRNFVVRIDECA